MDWTSWCGAPIERVQSVPQATTYLDRLYSVLMAPRIPSCHRVVPAPCLVGHNMKGHLLLRALGPLCVIVAMPLVGGAISLIKYLRSDRSEDRSTTGATEIAEDKLPRSRSDAFLQGVLSLTPASLVLAFCFTPPVRVVDASENRRTLADCITDRLAWLAAVCR